MNVLSCTRFALALAGLVVLSATGCSEDTPPVMDTGLAAVCPQAFEVDQRAHWVCAIGNRGEMMATGDLAGQLDLNTLPALANMVGLGPLAGLKGEITIDQGTVYLSTIDNGEQIVTLGAEGEAVFFAFGAAQSWHEVAITQTLDGFDAIEAFIAEAAAERGLDPNGAFPFRITGTPPALDYHVIFIAHSGHHGPHGHADAKVAFTAHRQAASLVGIWADEASGSQYTHKGRRTHIHVVLEDRSGSGHVDGLTLAPGMTLHLPAQD